MFDLSDDDSFSTQLEGKNLKNRGAHLKGAIKNSPLLEIEKDAPGLMEEAEIEEGQEYFTERELQPEHKREREERLKREINAARRQQQEMQKQQQQQMETARKPDENYAEKEQGMLQSRNKNNKTVSTHFKQTNQPADELAAQHNSKHKKADMPLMTALLGDNTKNLDMAEQRRNDKSVPAKLLPDVRGKEPALGM